MAGHFHQPPPPSAPCKRALPAAPPPAGGSSASGRRLLLLPFFLLASALLFGAPLRAAETFHLISTGRELAPAESLGIRFSSRMVENAATATGDVSPVEVEPPVPFHFEWVASSAGAISFPSAPPLGIELRFKPRPGLKNLAGQPILPPSPEVASRRTPPYGLAGLASHSAIDMGEHLPPLPVILISLNFKPAAGSLSNGLLFQSDRGESVPVATKPSLNWRAITWREAFLPQNRGRTSLPIPNGGNSQFYVLPKQPLAPGRKWSLALTPNLRDAEAPDARPFSTTTLVPVGVVRELKVTNVTLEHAPLQKVRLKVALNKPASEGETAKIKVIPPVLEPSKSWSSERPDWDANTLELEGTVPPGTQLQAVIPEGLLSQDGTPLESSVERSFTVPPLPARLYFDRFLARQFSAGNRELHVLGVHAATPVLRVQRVPPEAAIETLRRWTSYRELGEKKSGERAELLTAWPDANLRGPLQRNHKVNVPLPEDATVFDKPIELGPPANAPPNSNSPERECTLRWDDLVGKDRKGMFLVSLEGRDASDTTRTIGAQTLVELSDIGLVAWLGSDGKKPTRQVHAHSLASGHPLPNTRLRFFSSTFELLEEALTDASGIAASSKPNAQWVCASLGEDAVSMNLRSEYEQRWGSAAQSDEDSSGRAGTADDAALARHAIFLFTDRGLYRPGETVHARAFVRGYAPGQVSTPKPLKLVASLRDTHYREILRRNLTTDEQGNCSIDFELPQAPGVYTLNLHSDGSISRAYASIRVADFEQDRFSLELLGERELPAGAPLEISAHATYLSGQPLQGAKLSWTLHSIPQRFRPTNFRDFEFGPQPPLYERTRGADPGGADPDSAATKAAASLLPREGALTLNDDGHGRISIPPPSGAPLLRPVSLLLEAELTDQNQQTLVASHAALAHGSDFYLGMRLAKRWVPQGTHLPLAIVAIDADGNPLPSSISAELSLQRVSVQQTLYDAGGETHRKFIETLEPVWTKPITTTAPARIGDRWSVPPESESANLKDLPSGSYLLRVSSKDSSGRPVQSELRLDVGSPSVKPLAQHTDDEQDALEAGVFTLTCDRSNSAQGDGDEEDSHEPAPVYFVGETMRLLVTSEKPGNALLTIQQGKVLRSRTVELRETRTELEVPLLDEDVPNVTVHITRLRGLAQSERASKSPRMDSTGIAVRVFPKQSRLKLAVSGIPNKVRPGDELKAQVRVSFADGSPAADADVTFWAVDEGVLRMTRYDTPEPLQRIFQPIDLETERLSNMGSFLPENRDPAYAYLNKGYIVGEGKGEFRGQIRGNFPLTPVWIGSLRTDGNGVVQTGFRAPDNLSEFRVMAVATHGAVSFGSTHTSFKTQKTLQIQPGTPQFARLGDKLQLRGIVQNSGSTPYKVQVDLSASEGVTLSSTNQTVTVPPRATVPVSFDATFTQLGNARLEWRARTLETPAQNMETDGVETFMDVTDSAPLHQQSLVIQIPPGSHDLRPSLPPDLLKPGASLRLAAFYKPIAQLQPAAENLLHYPYGCAEQTISSTIPWLLVHKLALPNVASDRADAMIRKGLDRLLDMRSTDAEAGFGISYWPGARAPMPFANAYAGVLLGTIRLLRPADFERLVPQSLRSMVQEYLSQWLRAPSDAALLTDTAGQAMATYALAAMGFPEPGAEERLLGIADILSDEERALLALALLQRPGTEATAQRLLSMEGGPESESYFWTPARSLGIRLLAWQKLAPSSPETTQLLSELLRSQSSGAWGNTQSNAWALLAIAETLPQSPAPTDLSGVFSVGSEQIAFSLSEVRQTDEFSRLLKDANETARLSVRNDSQKPIYVRVDLSRREETSDVPKLREGYTLERSFQKVDSQNKPVPGPLRPGDRVQIELTLTAHQAGHFLAIECPLPSVLEPDQAFATRSGSARGTRRVDSFCDFSETHADRLVFFKNSLRKGAYTIRAMARVRAAGDAIAPAAKVEEMYRSERFGRTGMQRLTVETN